MKGKKLIFAPVSGAVTAYAITLLVFIVYALLLTYTGISEKNNTAVVIVTMAMSLVAGGVKSALSARQKGLIWGVATGVLYVAVMIAAGLFLIPGYTLGSKTLVCLLLGIGSGGLGGVIGVNLFCRK